MTCTNLANFSADFPTFDFRRFVLTEQLGNYLTRSVLTNFLSFLQIMCEWFAISAVALFTIKKSHGTFPNVTRIFARSKSGLNVSSVQKASITFRTKNHCKITPIPLTIRTKQSVKRPKKASKDPFPHPYQSYPNQ